MPLVSGFPSVPAIADETKFALSTSELAAALLFVDYLAGKGFFNDQSQIPANLLVLTGAAAEFTSDNVDGALSELAAAVTENAEAISNSSAQIVFSASMPTAAGAAGKLYVVRNTGQGQRGVFEYVGGQYVSVLPDAATVTGEQIVTKLASLTGTARLSYNSLKDLPPAGGSAPTGRKLFAASGMTVDVAWIGPTEPSVTGSGGSITVQNDVGTRVGTITVTSANAASDLSLTRINKNGFQDRAAFTIVSLQNGRAVESPEQGLGIIHTRTYGGANEVTDAFAGISGALTQGYEITFAR